MILSGVDSAFARHLARLTPREIPTLFAGRFPLVGQKVAAEAVLQTAALRAQMRHIVTAKVSLYLPPTLRFLLPGTRVALVTNHLSDVEAHAKVARCLTGLALNVGTAALFAPPDVALERLFVGRQISRPLHLPADPPGRAT